MQQLLINANPYVASALNHINLVAKRINIETTRVTALKEKEILKAIS